MIFGEQIPGIAVKFAGAIAACGASLLAIVPASAQSIDDRYWIEVSAYRPKIATDVQISSIASHTIGTNINVESDLGLKDGKVLPAIQAGVRIRRNWLVTAEAYALKRHNTRTLSRDITFDDVTYPTSASITTKFHSDVYRLTVGYALIRNKNLEAGAAIGVHATDIEASLEGEGRIGNSSAQLRRRTKEFFAPLPTVGLFAHVRVVPGVTVNGRVDYLSLSVGDYDGRLVNAQVSATYRFLRNVGVGVGYRFVDYRVIVDKESYAGRFDYRFTGPEVSLQFGF